MAGIYRTILVMVDQIIVPQGRRPVDATTVARLADSIKKIGLQNPISVRAVADQRYILIAGRHRLEATRANGTNSIRVSVMDVDDVEARLWEISENLHRADLTALERNEQIEEWRTLTEEKVRNVSAPFGGPQPKEAGNRKVAAELGIDEKAVRNATKIAAIADDAKVAAKEAGLDQNQSALLIVASAAPDKQVEAVAEIVAAKASKRIPAAIDPPAVVEPYKSPPHGWQVAIDWFIRRYPQCGTSAMTYLMKKGFSARPLSGKYPPITDLASEILCTRSQGEIRFLSAYLHDFSNIARQDNIAPPEVDEEQVAA